MVINLKLFKESIKNLTRYIFRSVLSCKDVKLSFIKLTFIPLLILLTLLTQYFTIYATSSNFSQEIYPITECNDGIDNDGDGGIDFATDPQCTSWTDTSEFPDPIPPISYPERPEEPENPVDPVTPIFNIPITPEIEEELDPINGLFTEFLWKPLGSALGIDQNIIETKSTGYTITSLVLLSVGYLIIVIGVGIFYVKSRKSNTKSILKV